jgi:hypothetical protein
LKIYKKGDNETSQKLMMKIGECINDLEQLEMTSFERRFGF